jgi:hypothetical protein
MATEKMRLNPDSWAKVRIHFQGDELAAQVDETVVRTSHFTLANSKPAFALLASGRAAGFRRLVVTDPKLQPGGF